MLKNDMQKELLKSSSNNRDKQSAFMHISKTSISLEKEYVHLCHPVFFLMFT